jgi:hypothetical protein
MGMNPSYFQQMMISLKSWGFWWWGLEVEIMFIGVHLNKIKTHKNGKISVWK